VLNLLNATPLPEGVTGEDASTYREMLVAITGLEEVFGPELKGKEFMYGSDNKGLVRAFQVGSPVPVLQDLAVRYYLYCREELNGARPIFTWMPRNDLVLEDYLSKEGQEKNDYQVTVQGWRRIVGDLLGLSVGTRGMIDVFASPRDLLREVMPTFWGRYYYKESREVDAFMQKWTGMREWLWMFPPIPLLSKVINKIIREKAVVVLVLPMWQNRPWWPIIFDEKGHARREVRAWSVVRKGEITWGK